MIGLIETRVTRSWRMFMEKYGLSFSLRALKENKPEVWERFKDDFKDIKIEDEEVVL